MRGALRVTARTSAVKGSTASVMSGEWKACEVCSLRQVTEAAFSRASRVSMACSPPETTVRAVELTAAIDSPSPSHAAVSSSGRNTDSMAPSGIDCASRPRAATRRTASGRENTPATVAATNSPTLCPAMARGVTPQNAQSRARAYSTQKRPAWANSVRVSRSEPSGANTRARGSWPRCSVNSSAQRSNSAANTGSWSYSSRPMPTYWAPWPGNSKATGARSPATGPDPMERSAATRSFAPFPTATARWPKGCLRHASVYAASSRSVSGWRSRCSARRRALSVSACGVFPDRASSRTGRPGPEGAAGSGASSRTTCTLVPPMPKELTPARRGASARGHGRRSVLT